MKILYGVQATGNGHITRSREVIRELKRRGHDVLVIFSGRSPSMLWGIEEFEPYQIYRGLTFSTDRGNLKLFKTALNLDLPRFYKDIHCYNATDFELVITDFEPISARIAKKHHITSIGIGHQYAFLYDIPMAGANFISKFVLKNYAPAEINVGLHWHHFNLPLLPPIIPDKYGDNHKIKEAQIVVYLPFEALDDILTVLRNFRGYDFFVYHRLERDSDRGHIHLRAYSRSGFLKDLVESSGVICNAGFELPSESMYLGKKILVKPLIGQMEQMSNALVISSLNLGTVMNQLNETSITQFLDSPSVPSIKYPKVARIVVDWIESGQWEALRDKAMLSWKETM